jgi:hypothetical protein
MMKQLQLCGEPSQQPFTTLGTLATIFSNSFYCCVFAMIKPTIADKLLQQ